MNARTWVVLGAILGWTTIARASDELPFEIQNARTTGISDRVETGPDGIANWSYVARIAVAGAGGARDPKGLAVAIAPLEADKGWRSASTKARLADLPAALGPAEYIELAITAVFSRLGDYRSELVLYQGAVQRVVPIAVKVEAPTIGEAPLVEHGHATVALDESPTGEAAVVVKVEVRNAGTTLLALGKPRLVSARRADRADKATSESQIAAADLAEGSAVELGALAAGDVKAILLELKGLDEPGSYHIEVQLTVAGYAPKAIEVTVYRGRHWLRASMWIAFGVLVAYGVRRYTQGSKDRLKARRALADLRPYLTAIRDEAREPAHVAAAMVLGAEIDQRTRELRWQGDGATLLATAVRLVARVYLLGEVEAAARAVARLDASAQAEPRKVLDDAVAVVRVDPGADKAATIDEQRRKVVGLGVEDAWRSQLRAAVAELNQATAALAGAGTSDLRRRVTNELRPKLALAADALAAGRLDNCAQQLDGLRPAFLAIAIAGLRARIDDVPLGANATDWPKVQEAVIGSLDVADAPGEWAVRLKSFIEAQRAYFRAAVAALVGFSAARAADTATPARDPARLTEIATELRAKLDAGDTGVDRAAQIYAERVDDVARAERAQSNTLKVASGGDTAPAAAFIAVPRGVGARGAGPQPPEVQLLDATIRYTEWLVTLAVLGVAIASGVKALWLPSLAWGIDGDALTAFLWGAGVGTVGDAFTGLIGLREKLGSGP